MSSTKSEKKLLVIVGPTATGKTDVALSLARELGGELVACDSRQVYVGLDLGTGKMPGKFPISNFQFPVEKRKGFWIVNGVKIWMYDVVDAREQYSAYQYAKEAGERVGELVGRGKLPILVGGTGLYLRALLEGLDEVGEDQGLREELEGWGIEELQKKIQSLSPTLWDGLNGSERKNKRRLTRHIEKLTVEPDKQSKISNFQFPISNPDVLKIGLFAAKEVLNQRIDQRVVSRMDQGMVEEAESLHRNGLSLERMRQLGLEYGVLADYIAGNIKDQDELIKVMQNKIHQYAKRQMTWFKRDKEVSWFDISDRDFMGKVEKEVVGWYNS